MAFSPSIDVQYLHQLAWRPAQFAHPLWLAAVGVNPENYGYGRSRALDSALNGMLIQRRNFRNTPACGIKPSATAPNCTAPTLTGPVSGARGCQFAVR